MKKTLLTLAISFLSIINANASTKGIAFSPLKIDIENISEVQTINLNNNSDQPRSYQLDILKWDIIDKKEVFSKTNNFIVSPIIVKVNPNSKQTIRIGTKNINHTELEQSYRIYFHQLPSKNPKGIQVLTNISIPIFISPINKQDIKNVSEYTIVTPTVKNGYLENVTLKNNFNQHLKVIGLKILQKNKLIYSEKKLKYILAKKTNFFELSNIKISKNIPLEFIFEMQGHDNVKKQFIVK